jgi:outer membrane protein OmpA-like peptidoglycan-associated protein
VPFGVLVCPIAVPLGRLEPPKVARHAALIIALACTSIVALPARAQQFNAQTFRVSEHPYDLFGVKTTTISDGFDPGFGLVAHWGHNPLVFVAEGAEGEERQAVVQDQLTFELFASIALWRRLDLAVAAPLLVQGAGGSALTGVQGAEGFAMGDVRISLKGAILRDRATGLGIGADLTASFPTATAWSFAGDDAFTVTPSLLLDAELGGARLALNAGVRLRTAEATLDALRIRHALLLSLGAEVPLYAGLSVAGEAQTATDVAAPFADELTTQAEGRLGARYRFDSGLSIEAGGGAGFLKGYGNVAARAFLGVRYEVPLSAPAPEVVELPLPPPQPPVLASAVREVSVAPRAPEVRVEVGEPAPRPEGPALLTQPLYFRTGRERVPRALRPLLDEAALALRADRSLRVRVEGHADERWGDGTWPEANMRLSLRRARWVKAALVRRGVDPSRIEEVGLGDTHPATVDATGGAFEPSQRVELVLDGGTP